MKKFSRLAIKSTVSLIVLLAALSLVVSPALFAGSYHGPATVFAFDGNYSGTCSASNGHLSCTLQLVSGTPVPLRTWSWVTINTPFESGTFNGPALIYTDGKMSAN